LSSFSWLAIPPLLDKLVQLKIQKSIEMMRLLPKPSSKKTPNTVFIPNSTVLFLPKRQIIFPITKTTQGFCTSKIQKNEPTPNLEYFDFNLPMLNITSRIWILIISVEINNDRITKYVNYIRAEQANLFDSLHTSATFTTLTEFKFDNDFIYVVGNFAV
jgi:hypothetical protein